jgi:hypothetical protein
MDPHALTFHGGRLPRLELAQPQDRRAEWLLRPGLNRIGRHPENDICIEADGISSRHCEIVVGDQACTLIDLRSATGTWLNGQQIQAAPLRHGDLITVGQAQLRFLWSGAPASRLRLRPTGAGPAAESGHLRETGARSRPAEPELSDTLAPPLPPPVPDAAVTAPPPCVNHPQVASRFSCSQCRRFFCETCMGTSQDASTSQAVCPACGAACVPLTAAVGPAEAEPIRWLSAWWGAWRYPASTEGIVILAAGAILLWLIEGASFLAGFVPLFGWLVGVFLSLLCAAMTFSFVKSVIYETAMGSDRVPDWPDVSDLHEDFLTPLWQLFSVWVVGMPIAVLWMVREILPDWPSWVWVSVGVWSAVYLPMSLLSLSLFNTVGALDPRVVLPSLVRVGPLYWVCVLWLLALAAFATGIMLLWERILPAFFAGLFQYFALLYALLWAARVLGLLYRFRKDQLGWDLG